jgi:hypothetical protein
MELGIPLFDNRKPEDSDAQDELVPSHGPLEV